MDIFEKYSSEILFEQPIKYLGVTIYPVLMKDVFVFYKCAGVLLINPLDFNDPKVASMSYLELVINLALFQEDFKKNFIDILCLTMHIVEDDIKINSFGTLKNKEINLDKNVNIIYGKNESGKSTLLTYIKTAFYGISRNKNGKEAISIT